MLLQLTEAGRQALQMGQYVDLVQLWESNLLVIALGGFSSGRGASAGFMISKVQANCHGLELCSVSNDSSCTDMPP